MAQNSHPRRVRFSIIIHSAQVIASVRPHVQQGARMNDTEDKYALFGLTEEVRKRLVQLADLRPPPEPDARRLIVETVIVHDGARTTIRREEQGG